MTQFLPLYPLLSPPGGGRGGGVLIYGREVRESRGIKEHGCNLGTCISGQMKETLMQRN